MSYKRVMVSVDPVLCCTL